jgi:hypothetical protein
VDTGVTPDSIAGKLRVRSWDYEDTPKYGSPEHDPRDHKVAGVNISRDRKAIRVSLPGFGKEGPWTDRVYHIKVNDASALITDGTPWNNLEAYYTIRAIPTGTL